MTTTDSIDIKATWKATAQVLIALLQDGTETGKQLAKEEILRMADVADLHVQSQGVVPLVVIEVTNDHETIITANSKVDVVVINDRAPSYRDGPAYKDVELPARGFDNERKTRLVTSDVEVNVETAYVTDVHSIADEPTSTMGYTQ